MYTKQEGRSTREKGPGDARGCWLGREQKGWLHREQAFLRALLLTERSGPLKAPKQTLEPGWVQGSRQWAGLETLTSAELSYRCLDSAILKMRLREQTTGTGLHGCLGHLHLLVESNPASCEQAP